MLDTLPPRIAAKVEVIADPNACWTWRAARTSAGYGAGWDGGRMVKAHRLVYELLVGPIPAGLELDHLCRNKGCVRPDHLEPVTHGENIRRASDDRVECKNGHPLTPDNTFARPAQRSRRLCRTCHRERSARSARARRNQEVL